MALEYQSQPDQAAKDEMNARNNARLQRTISNINAAMIAIVAPQRKQRKIGIHCSR